MTDDADIRIALDYLPYDKRADLGICSAEERAASVAGYGGSSNAVLDPLARAATSRIVRMDDEREAEVVARLASDLDSGAWDRARGYMCVLPAFDVGLRLTVTELQ